MSPGLIFGLSWGLWLLSWFAASWWASPAVRRAPPRESLLYNLPILIGVWLLLPFTARHLHPARLWHVGWTGAYLLAVLTVPSFLFCWWARIHLGKLWSAEVTRKADHRVVDSGPYAIVRHPIYTGMIAATLLSAAAISTLSAIAGAMLMTGGLWLKARTEEQFLAKGSWVRPTPTTGDACRCLFRSSAAGAESARPSKRLRRFPELELLDLAGRGFRDFREHDQPRAFVVREM